MHFTFVQLLPTSATSAATLHSTVFDPAGQSSTEGFAWGIGWFFRLLWCYSFLQVVQLPRAHHQLQYANEFKDLDHWPKHVLVEYIFDTQNDVDLERGLYAVMLPGVCVCASLCVSSGRSPKFHPLPRVMHFSPS